jgi:hypothetical protein
MFYINKFYIRGFYIIVYNSFICVNVLVLKSWFFFYILDIEFPPTQ